MGGPWSISLAADGAGERYIGRDGTQPGAGFRTAGKVEWKGGRSSLFRFNTSLRGPELGEHFNRGSAGLYYRFPVPAAKQSDAAPFPLREARLTLTADRNATITEKIIDGIDGSIGLSLNLPPVPIPGFYRQSGAKNRVMRGSPLGITLKGSLNGRSAITGETPSPYPWPQSPWDFDSAAGTCEFAWSPGIFQFKTKLGCTAAANKDGQWDAAFSAGVRFKYGRFSVKTAAEDFPNKWNCTVSWRLEKK
jgi:hypothetical protein